MTIDLEREVARALLLEKRGHLEAAVQAYQNAGAVEDAARVLDLLGRHDQAGELLWQSLQTDLAGLDHLPPEKKKIALKAAVSYAQGSQTGLALLVMLALGERRMAAELQQRIEGGTSGPLIAAEPSRRVNTQHPTLVSATLVSATPVSATPVSAMPVSETSGPAVARTTSGAHPAVQLQATAVPTPARRTTSVPIVEERISAPPRRMSGQFATVGTSAAQTPSPLDEARALERSGHLQEALAAYLQLGKLSWAARVTRALGRLDEAGELYLKGELFLEAAACFLESGAHTQCMQSLLRVEQSNPGYRDACVHLIRLASQLNVLDSQLEPFISDFVSAGPLREQEYESFYLLACLREAHQFVEPAKDAYRRLLAVQPDYADAAQQLARLEDTRSGRVTGRTDTRPPIPGSGPVPGSDRIGRADSRPPTVPPVRRDSVPPVRRDSVPPARRDSVPNLSGIPIGPLQPGMGGPISVGDGAHRRSTGTIMIAGAPLSSSDGRRPSPLPSVGLAQFAASASGVGQNPLFASSASGATPNPLLMPAGALTIGSLVADRYRLDSRLGQGGMATVFKALDTEIGEEIALKLFTQQLEDEGMLLRFRQELSLSRQLNHPNIIRLFDIGSHYGMRFITMELLRGHELRDDLRRGPLPFRAAVDLLLQACAGLAVAHARGIVHRDVKPENFFITSDGVLKIMDFGIAKRQSAPGFTISGTMAGTPTYMSPEQISNFAAVTHATDLYALGVLAYEMFTGGVPFVGPEIMPILNGHLQKTPDSMRQRNPAVPEEVERIVMRLLAKQPGDRYIDCDELADDLREIRDTLPE